MVDPRLLDRPADSWLAVIGKTQQYYPEAMLLGGNAIVGVDLDYEVMGHSGGMLMVSVSGTAVVLD